MLQLLYPLNKQRILLVNFKQFVETIIFPPVVESFNRFSLVKYNVESQRFLDHHFLFQICNQLGFFSQQTKQKCVFYNSEPIDLSPFCLEQQQKIKERIEWWIKRIQKFVPIVIFTTNTPFTQFTQLLSEDGKRQEIIQQLLNFIESKTVKNFSYAKAQTYARQNGLIFLTESFFGNLKAKELLIYQ